MTFEQGLKYVQSYVPQPKLRFFDSTIKPILEDNDRILTNLGFTFLHSTCATNATLYWLNPLNKDGKEQMIVEIMTEYSTQKLLYTAFFNHNRAQIEAETLDELIDKLTR